MEDDFKTKPIMSWTRFFRRRYWDQERARELEAYLEIETDENIARGMSPEEARYAAHRNLGNVTLIREEVYRMNSLGWLETFWQDLRFAARTLAKNPGFTVVAVLTLALGIGVNTAIFSLVDQLLLWSVPAREPNRLVKLEGQYSSTYPFFCAYRDLNQVFSGVLASSENLDTGIRPSGAPAVELGHVEYVSGGYFQILGIGSAAGRVITPSDDAAPGGSPVAVLSYRYWQRRFAGDLRVIGRKLAVNTYPLVIVGIAEKGFGGLFNGDEPDAFIPLAMYPVTTPVAARVWNTTHMDWLLTVARLKPGISIQQAQAGMQVLWSQAVETVNDAGVSAVGRAQRFQRSTAAGTRGPCRFFYPQPEVLGSAQGLGDRHGPGAADCLRQRGQSAARARLPTVEGDRRASGARRNAWAFDPPVPHRKSPACGCRQRGWTGFCLFRGMGSRQGRYSGSGFSVFVSASSFWCRAPASPCSPASFSGWFPPFEPRG